MAEGEAVRDHVLNRVDAKVSVDALEFFAPAAPSLWGSRQDVTVEQRLYLYVADKQRERVMRRKMLDAERNHAVDEPFFKPPRPAVEHELERARRRGAGKKYRNVRTGRRKI